jgi:hypothetical protein
MSLVKKASKMIIKINEAVSFIEASPVTIVNIRTTLIIAIKKIVIYSGLNFITVCKLITLFK